jgi:hypothetical protein
MSGRIVNNLIEVRQGDSFAINFEIKKKCKPVDLTGATLLMQVRDSNNNLVFAVSGTDVDIKNGKMALLLTPTQTSAQVGDYNIDIQLTTADGSVNTIFPANVNQIATFRVTEQVTTGA